jgi:hypothetical protein
MGIINPIKGLIVLPTKVMASPMLGMNRARQQFMVTSKNVIKKFCLFVSFYPFIKNSSIESLLGKITRGKLEITEKSIVKLDTCINVIPL